MTLKQIAEETVRKFWEAFASREGDVEANCFQYIHDDFIGYGTESHEVWLSQQDFRQQLISELEFVPEPVHISVKSMNTVVYGSTAVCLADMHYRVSVEHREFEIDPFRLIMTLIDTDSGPKFISMASISFDFNLPDQVPWPGLIKPTMYPDVSILFTDFVGFSKTVAAIPPEELVHQLNDIFSTFDDIVKIRHLEKVKTIGDAYMAVSGVRPEQTRHAEHAVEAGLEMIKFLEARRQSSELEWGIRVGVHTGPVVAGIVGKQGLSFDVWGDTVNLANQMEQKGEPGYVNVSIETYRRVKHTFDGRYRGKIEVKNQRPVDMYLINP